MSYEFQILISALLTAMREKAQILPISPSIAGHLRQFSESICQNEAICSFGDRAGGKDLLGVSEIPTRQKQRVGH